MKLLTSLASILSAMLIGSAASATILPPNDLHLEDNLFTSNANIDEELFNEIIDHVGAKYVDIISSHGGTLKMNKLWTNSTVNASAQQSGNTWIVNMYGGLARREEVTPDGFALVVCHELGHHLAGFPFYGSDWAASEGESDYFATQACSRRIWKDEKEKNAESAATVHPIAKDRCDAVWSTEDDRNLCYRTAMAGESLAKLLAALGRSEANFETPDTSEVSQTKTSHPKGQCRLDTYFEGALCTAKFDDAIIPGRRHPDGQGSLGAEQVAAKYSCSRAAFFPNGTRPRCWFKPKLQSLLTLKDVQFSETNGNGNGAAESGEVISLTVQLENLASRAYENIRATISSIGNKFSVIRGETVFDKIGGQTSKAGADAFEIKIGNVTCGEKIGMNINLDLGEGKAAQLSHKLQIGRLVQTEKITKKQRIDIPDNDPKGITSTINIEEDGSFSAIALDLQISHTYQGDLTVTLISPEGERFVVHKRTGGSKDNLEGTFDINPPNILSAKGEWKLNVADSTNRDTGALHSWGLQFTKAVCE